MSGWTEKTDIGFYLGLFAGVRDRKELRISSNVARESRLTAFQIADINERVSL